MHHGKRVENYTFAEEETYTLRVEESKERGILAAKGKGFFPLVIVAHRAWCKSAEIQRRRDAPIYNPAALRMAFYLFVGMESRYLACPMCTNRARVTRYFSPKKWTMFQRGS